MQIQWILIGILAVLSGCVTPELSDDEVATRAEERTRATCGATFSMTEGDLSGSGLYAIGAYPEPGRGEIVDHIPTVGEIQAFIGKHRDVLDAPKHALGVYCEGADGKDCKTDGAKKCWLDITRFTGN